MDKLIDKCYDNPEEGHNYMCKQVIENGHITEQLTTAFSDSTIFQLFGLFSAASSTWLSLTIYYNKNL